MQNLWSKACKHCSPSCNAYRSSAWHRHISDKMPAVQARSKDEHTTLCFANKEWLKEKQEPRQDFESSRSLLKTMMALGGSHSGGYKIVTGSAPVQFVRRGRESQRQRECQESLWNKSSEKTHSSSGLCIARLIFALFLLQKCSTTQESPLQPTRFPLL